MNKNFARTICFGDANYVREDMTVLQRKYEHAYLNPKACNDHQQSFTNTIKSVQDLVRAALISKLNKEIRSSKHLNYRVNHLRYINTINSKHNPGDRSTRGLCHIREDLSEISEEEEENTTSSSSPHKSLNVESRTVSLQSICDSQSVFATVSNRSMDDDDDLLSDTSDKKIYFYTDDEVKEEHLTKTEDECSILDQLLDIPKGNHTNSKEYTNSNNTFPLYTARSTETVIVKSYKDRNKAKSRNTICNICFSNTSPDFLKSIEELKEIRRQIRYSDESLNKSIQCSNKNTKVSSSRIPRAIKNKPKEKEKKKNIAKTVQCLLDEEEHINARRKILEKNNANRNKLIKNLKNDVNLIHSAYFGYCNTAQCELSTKDSRKKPVLVFDHQNPLANICMSPEIGEIHKYNPMSEVKYYQDCADYRVDCLTKYCNKIKSEISTGIPSLVGDKSVEKGNVREKEVNTVITMKDLMLLNKEK